MPTILVGQIVTRYRRLAKYAVQLATGKQPNTAEPQHWTIDLLVEFEPRNALDIPSHRELKQHAVEDTLF